MLGQAESRPASARTLTPDDLEDGAQQEAVPTSAESSAASAEKDAVGGKSGDQDEDEDPEAQLQHKQRQQQQQQQQPAESGGKEDDDDAALADEEDGAAKNSILENRPDENEIIRIREMLGRLQKQVGKQNRSPESGRVNVTLTREEVDLLGHLLGRGLIRSPSTIRSSIGGVHRKLTAVQYSALISRVRGDEHWPVHVGFKDLEYTVSVPKADVGIATVATTFYKIASPLINLFTCNFGDRVEIKVLRKMSGAFEAGKSTLVLGPPGCGVTTLFKVLSGRAKVGGRCKLTGDIYYSGFRPEELHVPKFAMYVDQVDQHTAVLTVRETLKFAYECFGGADAAAKVIASSATADEATEEEKAKIQEQLDNFPDFVIHNLALDRAADTVVGNDMVRGVSGGEKKRVTSGEMLMGRRPLTFYDQISTGLDSAATFDICRRITGVAKNLHTTPIVALLQPPPETYNLFDEILILALGYIVYHGPREEVLPYFSSIGFDCPYDRDIADFIQEVTTPARKKYQTRADAPQDEEAMAKAWEASPYSQAKRDAVAVRCNTDNKVDGLTRRELFAKDKPKYANSLFTELKLVLKRQNQLVYRDPAFVRARIMQSVIMGVVIGTIFIKLDPNLPDSNAAGDFTPITQRYGVTFATLMQCALAGMAQVPVVLGQRPVYYKQTNSYFFRTVSYVFAEFVTVIPIAIVESIILGALVFWITAIVPWGEDSQTGESDVGSRFMIFLCIMIAINVSFAAYLRAVTTMVPSASIGQVVAGISISASVVYSGFIIVQSAMPPWFIWIYWLSPIAWAYRSAVLTIFTSSAFTDEQSAFALDLFGFPSNKQYIWAGILMLIAYVLVDVCISMFGYTHVRYESGGGRQTKSNPDAEPNDNPDVVEVERVMQERSSEMRSASELAAARASTAPGQSALRMQTSLQNENFTPVDLVFRDLWYSVQAPGDKSGYNLDLLKGISGYAEAGTLTALMGSSGAGKTTLMDVLALRKTAGKTKGEVLVNGRPQEKTTFSRIIGYVEQNDIHSPSATVVEALTFSAVLRQPADVPRHEKESFVEGVLDTLDLQNIRDFKIGFKQSGGLSTEQVKRVTIGVELSANPAIIFADEPTSGLDASSAQIIMKGLKRIASAGRTVVCTIHQPSKDIFLKFDRLLLLRRGGEMVYFGDLGEKSHFLLEYLEAIPGTPSMPNARYNPATYMLEVIGAGAGEESLVDYAHEYRESKLRLQNEERIDALVKRNLDERPEIHFEHDYASGFGTQLELLTKRWFWGYWRNPGYNATRFLIAIFIALFFGFSFFQNVNDLTTTQDVQSVVGLTMISSAFLSVIALNTAIPTIMDERTPFYRERAASYYGVAPMIIAITVTEVPYVIAAALVYIPIFYFIVHFWYNAAAFFLYWCTYTLFLLSMTFWGHFLASVAPNQQVAGVLGAITFGLWVQTAGLVIAVRDIPIFWYWLSCINPIRYMFNALVSIQLACDDSSSDGPGCSTINTGNTAWGYVQDNFGFEADDYVFCMAALAGFVVGFRILSILAYTYVSFLKR